MELDSPKFCLLDLLVIFYQQVSVYKEEFSVFSNVHCARVILVLILTVFHAHEGVIRCVCYTRKAVFNRL